ncbi:MAG: hypothetical protein IH984_17455 [Planctomycetes bacterium]|nr:hypothetical protein [Planctomycetota bacterium]
MIASTDQQHKHLKWPSSRFYWAILDASCINNSHMRSLRRKSQQLGYIFESYLPAVAIEDIQAVYRPLSSNVNHYVACGLPKELLDDGLDPKAITLTPSELPSFIDQDCDPFQLNLLTDEYQPKILRQLHRRSTLLVCGIITICTILLIVGLERRTNAALKQIETLHDSQTKLLEQVFDSGSNIPGALPGALRITAELRRLQQTRSGDRVSTEINASSLLLANLLSLWPGNIHVQTESISITQTSITIRAKVPTMADVQQFADALAPLPSWQLKQPQSKANHDHIDVTLSFESVQEQSAK